MGKIEYAGKTFETDDQGFLIDHEKWDEDFSHAMAEKLDIPKGLGDSHWKVIRFIRENFEQRGKCPLVYQTCKMTGISLQELKVLFPTGYLRGACKIAGLTYREGYLDHTAIPVHLAEGSDYAPEKTYQVDIRGFLVYPDSWDPQWAFYKAHEMNMKEPMTDGHWKVIYFLRDSFRENGVVPTIYETCQANDIELEYLELLFPDGYHRGAVKIAGLRVR